MDKINKAAKKTYIFIECDLMLLKPDDNPLELLVKKPDKNKIIRQITEYELSSAINQIHKQYDVVI